MINKSMNDLFGDTLGKIFENILLLYYGQRNEEIKNCSDYYEHLLLTKYGVSEGLGFLIAQ